MISRTVRCVAGAAVAMLISVQPSAAQSCVADLNGDGVVNGADLGMLLGQWGQCSPGVGEMSPGHGSVLGGTRVTITGSGLISVTGVRIGGVPCTQLVLLSPTQLQFTTPPGALGSAPVVLETATSSVLAPTPFEYVQQAITAVTPNVGGFSGGNYITITGSNLLGTTAVRVGGVLATEVNVVNGQTVTARTPPGSVGTTDVSVVGVKGAISLPNSFTYVSVSVPSWATLLEANPDPVIVTSSSLRAAITATGLAWRVRHSASGVEMLVVPPGSFLMGCSSSNTQGCLTNENPRRTVTLTSPFYLGRYEVTQSQWTSVMTLNPSFFQGSSWPNSGSRPVEMVSWTWIQGYLAATGLRLPTEAEWEYACRGDTTTAFHSGPGFPQGTNDDSLVSQIAWYSVNAGGQTRVVGGRAPNGLGFHDMLGNVWEYVHDWMGPYPNVAQTDPTGPSTGTERVFRGGCYQHQTTSELRASMRVSKLPGYADWSNLGFRAACNP